MSLTAITRLTLTLPGYEDLVSSFSAIEKQGQRKDSQYMSIEQVVAEGTTNQVPTTNNRHITKVYYRKRFKAKQTPQIAKQQAPAPPVFGETLPDYDADLNSPIVSLKRKATPVSVISLRRSKRNVSADNGFKPITSVTPKTKAKKKKVTPQTPPPGKKNQYTFLLNFPDLAAIDRMIALGTSHPELPIDVLQKVAVETCGIPREEVETNLLLAAEPGDCTGDEGQARFLVLADG
jgi:hypothetical protein